MATNAHVIRNVPPRSILVSFPSAPAGDRGPLLGKVVYFDDARDLAILAVESRLPPLPVLKAHEFRRGQDVVFIGSPAVGRTDKLVLENVAGRGILGSRVKLDDLDYYQLSGSVNGGNSGGPVIDMRGRVIGVITSRASAQEGLGFCVPAADLGAAIDSASAKIPAGITEAAARHEATARLATMGSADRSPEQVVSEFLTKTEPATWLASFDANALLEDFNPRVAPFRDRLRKAAEVYAEDERNIASVSLAVISRIREAGIVLTCGTLLDSSMIWAPAEYFNGGTPRSFADFAGSYSMQRLTSHHDHRTALNRMRASITPQQPAVADQHDPPAFVPSPPARNATRSGTAAGPTARRPGPATAKSASKAPPKLTGPDSPAGKLEAARRLGRVDG